MNNFCPFIQEPCSEKCALYTTPFDVDGLDLGCEGMGGCAFSEIAQHLNSISNAIWKPIYAETDKQNEFLDQWLQDEYNPVGGLHIGIAMMPTTLVYSKYTQYCMIFNQKPLDYSHFVPEIMIKCKCKIEEKTVDQEGNTIQVFSYCDKGDEA